MFLELMLSLQTAPKPQTPVSLSYRGGTISIKSSTGIEQVPVIKPPEPKRTSFEFRDGNLSIKWDQKKVTVKLGSYVRSTQFVDVPTSPRLFSKEQIRDSIRAVEKGERSLYANALAGHELIGNELFLLMRWNDYKDRPVFETLVKIDITAEKPWFKVVNKMPGVSTAEGPVSDELFVDSGKLGTVARQPNNKWGLATWDLEQNFIRFFPVGANLFLWSIPNQSPQNLLFIEKTDYGTWLAGKLDLSDKHRVDIAESKNKVYFVSLEPTIIRIDSKTECRLRYADSGLEKQFEPWIAARFTKNGLLTWNPAKAPTEATLFGKDNFDPVATWKSK